MKSSLDLIDVSTVEVVTLTQVLELLFSVLSRMELFEER